MHNYKKMILTGSTFLALMAIGWGKMQIERVAESPDPVSYACQILRGKPPSIVSPREGIVDE
jgi:hypothetical protein